MRVLLDECVHAGIRKAFVGHSVTTVPQAGWSGIKNGELLALIAGNFDVFLTIDQNIRHQQNLSGLPFAILFVAVPDPDRFVTPRFRLGPGLPKRCVCRFRDRIRYRVGRRRV